MEGPQLPGPQCALCRKTAKLLALVTTLCAEIKVGKWNIEHKLWRPHWQLTTLPPVEAGSPALGCPRHFRYK